MLSVGTTTGLQCSMHLNVVFWLTVRIKGGLVYGLYDSQSGGHFLMSPKELIPFPIFDITNIFCDAPDLLRNLKKLVLC